MFALLCATNILFSQTQTEAYLSVHQKDVENKWKNELKEYKLIIDQCLDREKELYDTHYVFYHGQSGNLRIIHDFTKELFNLLGIHHHKKDFTFLRPWFNAPQSVDIDTFIENYTSHDEIEVLCVNLSLFGNLFDWGCCTFEYFYNNFAMSKPNLYGIVQDMFTKLDLNEKFIDDLIGLNYMTQTKEGSLIQIFIPKDLVDSCVYLSHYWLEPYHQQLDKTYYSASKNRHTKISPILEMYRNNPEKLLSIPPVNYDTGPWDHIDPNKTCMDELQARIILSKDITLNPMNGIKYFTYTTVSEKQMDQYKKELRKLTDKITTEWLERTSKEDLAINNITGASPLSKLLSFIK